MAVALGHVPMGVWYLLEIYIKGMIALWDWALAVVCAAMFAGVGMRMIGRGILADGGFPYHFTPEETERFNRVEHVARSERP